MGKGKDYSAYGDQLVRDFQALIREYNADPFGTQVPEIFKKPYRILHSVFVIGNSIRKTAEIAGIAPSKVKKIYIDRYITTYSKYTLLGRIPEGVNILKEAFGGRKKGRPRKDYKELAETLRKGNPLLWDRLIKAIFT